MKEQGHRRVNWLHWCAAGLLIAAFVAFVQWRSGAQSSGFGAYPDESSHYMSGLLIRDYLKGGEGSPAEFAERYYLFHPYFAIGYWPPLFYLVEGSWMAAVGYGRSNVLVLIGCIAGLNALLIFGLVRRLGSPLLAAATAVMFLLLPSVQWSSSVVMTDLMVAALCLGTTMVFGRFLDAPSFVTALAGGILAGLAILTKYSAAFVLLPPVLLVVLDRRWAVLRDYRAWAAAAVFALTCGPWVLYSRRFANAGFEGVAAASYVARLQEVIRGYYFDWGIVVFGAAVSMLWALWNWRTLTATWKLVVLQPPCFIGFLLAAPPDIEPRYLMLTYASLAAVMALAVHEFRPRIRRGLVIACACGVAVFGLTKTNGYRPLPPGLTRQVAADLIAANPSPDSAILVPTQLEGPMIAELASAQSSRPGKVLARPTKLLARTNWNGTEYSMTTPDLSSLVALFEELPIDTVLLARVPGRRDSPHDELLRTMVGQSAGGWVRQTNYLDPGGLEIEVFIRPSGNRSLKALLQHVRQRLR